MCVRAGEGGKQQHHSVSQSVSVGTEKRYWIYRLLHHQILLWDRIRFESEIAKGILKIEYLLFPFLDEIIRGLLTIFIRKLEQVADLTKRSMKREQAIRGRSLGKNTIYQSGNILERFSRAERVRKKLSRSVHLFL